MDLPSLRYVTQAGGRLAPERVRALRRARPAARLGPVRDVRPDRGHRPDGLPAARPRAPRRRPRSASPSPAARSRSSRCRSCRSRPRRAVDVGELVYDGRQRDARLRRRRRPTSRRGRESTAADRRRRPPYRRRPLRDHRPPQPLREGVRAADRPRPGGAGVRRPRARRGLLRRRRRPAGPGRRRAGRARWTPTRCRGDREGALRAAARAPCRCSRCPTYRGCRTASPTTARSWRSRHTAHRPRTSPHSTAGPPTRRGPAARCSAACWAGPTSTDDDTFVSLEGDSLSYVEMSLRLEEALGHAPGRLARHPIGDWRGPRRMPRTLARPRPSDRAPGPGRPTAVGSRRTAPHAGDQRAAARPGDRDDRRHARQPVRARSAARTCCSGWPGFNFGRFHLTTAPRTRPGAAPAHQRHPGGRAVGALARRWSPRSRPGYIGLTNVLLLNGVLGPRAWTEPAVVVLVHRGARRHPARADRGDGGAAGRPARAPVAVLAAVRAGRGRAAHPLRRRAP